MPDLLLPSRTPDHAGPAGRAWTVPTSASAPEWRATVGAYFLHQPGVHAFWSWWYVAAIHLRPIEGLPPARVVLPGATHELLALALNPEHQPHLLPDLDAAALRQRGLRYLTPADQVHQFLVHSDAEAARLLDLCVRACCDGHLAADCDFRGVWAEVVSNTAAHLAAGLHQPS